MKYSFSSSKIRTIVSHEYISKVKTKGFLIGTFIAPVLLLAVISIPVIITSYSMRNTTQKVAIVDKTSTATGEKIVKNDVNKFFLATGTEEQLRTRVLDQEIDGFLILTDNSVKEGKITVYTKGGGGLSFLESLDRNLGKIIRTERLLAAGADAKIIDIVKEGIDVKTEVVTAKGSVEDTSLASAGIGYVFGLLLYMMMLMYGSFVMRGVIEEKANRIIEIIASSARPFEIMLGKVIGIGSVGLT
jgi:ABC-2 type transport system permease protein